MNINQLKQRIQFVYVIRKRKLFLVNQLFLSNDVTQAIKFNTFIAARTYLDTIYNPFNEYKIIQISI